MIYKSYKSISQLHVTATMMIGLHIRLAFDILSFGTKNELKNLWNRQTIPKHANIVVAMETLQSKTTLDLLTN